MGMKKRTKPTPRVTFQKDSRGNFDVQLDGNYAGELEWVAAEVPDEESELAAWEFYDHEAGEWSARSWRGGSLKKAQKAITKHLTRDRDLDWLEAAEAGYEAFRAGAKRGQEWDKLLMFEKKRWVAVARAVVEENGQ